MITAFWPRRLVALATTAVCCAALWAFAAARGVRLQDNVEWSGFVLLGLMCVLGAYNLRKRLPSLPLAKSSSWLQWHIYLGLLAIGLIHIHVGWHLPHGALSWLLYGLFWATSISGFAGLALSRTLPRLLTSIGDEAIFERIPDRVGDLHDEAAGIVQNALAHPEGTVLAGFFLDRLGPFLAAPSRAWHAGHERWITQQCANAARLAGPGLAEEVADLAAIAREKLALDRQFLVQSVLKGWLFVHLPLAAMTLIVAFYHTAISLWFRS